MVDSLTGPQSFARRMNRRAKNLSKNVDRLRRDVSAEMLREVVRSTPVDRGVARSNWQVGVNSAPEGSLPAYAPGRNLGIEESANANAAIAVGLSKIATANSDDTVYIVNNSRHIGYLNKGHSEQAGARFVERAFDRARKRIQRANARLLSR